MAIPDSIFNPDQAALEAGFENLKWHINNVHKYGIPAVVAINQFPQDSVEELSELESLIERFNPEVKLPSAPHLQKAVTVPLSLLSMLLKHARIHRSSPLFTRKSNH